MFDVYFEPAYEIVLVNEGGYVDDPKDAGGETYKGISRKYHPDWEGWYFIDLTKTHPLFKEKINTSKKLQLKVKTFYYSYWRRYNIHTIGDKEAATLLFDATVLMGVQATKIFQASINLALGQCRIAEDGVLGKKTAEAFDDAIQWNAELYIAGLLGYLLHSGTAKYHYKGWRKRFYNNLKKLRGL